MNAIARHAVGDIIIDDHALVQRQLRVDFVWPLADGAHVELEATYPSSFPRLRPQVKLKAEPDTFPARHVGPNGELCLLGRDSGLWQAKTTLADLLTSNLESALTNSGPEDPQGEPIEVWWNGVQRFDHPNYLLVDSAWDVSGFEGGVAEIIYRFELLDARPRFVAAVDKIWAGDRETLLFERSFTIPKELVSATRLQVTWRRDDELPLPNHDRLQELLDRLDHKGWHQKTPLGMLRISLTAQRTELQHDTEGDGFVCVVALTRGSGKKSQTRRFNVPVFRAGERDIGYRVPSTQVLRRSRVALIGLGALGSPLAVELARNRVAELTLVDHDVVEPGNSVRWVIGASAWGKRKPHAIAAHIEAEYPWTKATPFEANVGLGSGHGDEAELLSRIIAQADLVIDASASTGVTWYLSDECRRLGKTMVSLAATASLKGGTVSLYRPTSGCPICREHAYVEGTIPRAPGATDYSELTQPPGCAENTFTGASFDLQELVLQAVRLSVETLDDGAGRSSVVQTLSLHDGTRRTLPAWTENELPASPRCGCVA
ncbi:ThiF family adenylyltransferase [Ciceribacter sp. RN22]|nr:ThiF family adenylyltransferase [Ciceribacter sp. RN22]